MSPERLDPNRFNLEDGRPTKESDCYALGMVIYEVLSGKAPFAALTDYTIMRKIIEGERPGRPEGAQGLWFTEDLWEMLNQCWAAQQESRPSIEVVLECLEQVSRVWKPPSEHADEDPETDEDDWDLTAEVVLPVWFLVSIHLASCSCRRLRADRVSDPLLGWTPLGPEPP